MTLHSEDSLSVVLDWNLPFLRTPMEADGGEEQVQGAVVASGDGLGSWPNSWDLQRNIDWPSDFHPWTDNNL